MMSSLTAAKRAANSLARWDMGCLPANKRRPAASALQIGNSAAGSNWSIDGRRNRRRLAPAWPRERSFPQRPEPRRAGGMPMISQGGTIDDVQTLVADVYRAESRRVFAT